MTNCDHPRDSRYPWLPCARPRCRNGVALQELRIPVPLPSKEGWPTFEEHVAAQPPDRFVTLVFRRSMLWEGQRFIGLGWALSGESTTLRAI